VRPVVVVGDLMVDVVARMEAPLAVGSDTPARISTRPGGSAANVAAWLGEAGVPVTLVARAGDDPAARRALDGLERHGVRTAVALDRGAPTGTCVVLVGPDGERSMLPDPGANALLRATDLPGDAFAAGAHLHLTGYALLRAGPPREAALAALRRARASGMTISVDPSSAAPLRRLGAARFLELAGHPDLLLPNRDEAGVLAGEGDPGVAARALAAHAREVVVTLDAAGALWTDGRVTLDAPAAAVPDGVTDSTGAGDAFAAGFLAAWLDGAPPGGALQAGNALARRALVV
jgi:sugar/nucleoside kinase (ribokinase family)